MKTHFIENPSDATIASVRSGLVEYNRTYLEHIDDQDFALLMHNNEEELLGGMTGKLLKGESLFVQFFWVSDKIRGQGYGQKLMQSLEMLARLHGVKNLYLDTYTFQAPKFYQAAGFVEVGRFTDYLGKGIDKIFYQKSI
jgi:GNAT superfamily N-acetyltransferase